LPTVKLSTKEDIEDLVRGCTFFGTGGGGRPTEGIKLLTRVLQEKGYVEWRDVDELPESGYAVCPFLMGSIAPLTEETLSQMQKLGLNPEKKADVNLLTKAVEMLEKFTGIHPSVIVPIELGGANTPAAITAASDLGLTVVDGDFTGRAIPEIVQITPHLHGKDACPIASFDQWGNVCYIDKAISPAMAERIGKYLSAAAFGIAGQAGYLMPISEMRTILVRNTLTECLEVGRLIRTERQKGRSPLEKLVAKLNGKLLFVGTVTGKRWEDRDGYYWGYHEVTGESSFKGHSFKIWFKNENHVSWFDNEPYVTSPDMLIVVTYPDCEPLYNPDIKEGMMVAVIGVPARKEFLCEKGLQVLGPRHFGFELDYRPFELVTRGN